MPTHIALLRGINLAGNKRIAMADLRDVVASLGHDDVTTYIQSGNVLFSSPEADTEALAAGLEEAVAGRLGIQTGIVVLTRDGLAKVIADNPYLSEPNPKYVHVIFLPTDPEPDHAARLAEFERLAAEKGSRDTVHLGGQCSCTRRTATGPASWPSCSAGPVGRCRPRARGRRATGPR